MIEATLTGDDAVIARLERAPNVLRDAFVDAMHREWDLVQETMVDRKLSGDPLKQRTGRLARSVKAGGSETASEFVDTVTRILARVGTRVPYGTVHERGGTYTIRAHERRVMSRLGPHKITVRDHTATFPARSFEQSTLDELRVEVFEELEAATMKAAAQV